MTEIRVHKVPPAANADMLGTWVSEIRDGSCRRQGYIRKIYPDGSAQINSVYHLPIALERVPEEFLK